MASGPDPFEERLKTLNKTPPQAPASAPRTPDMVAHRAPRRQRSGDGSSLVLGAIALMVLIVGGGAFATMAFAPDLVFSTEALK